MKVQVLDIKGLPIKNITISDRIWGIEPHQQAIYETVVAQQAALRQGTRKTKTRAEVRGGGRKPWRQKGTGRARQGSIRSPQWRGGGVVFGPTPDINYRKEVNKKVRKLALKSALSLKVREDGLKIIDQFQFEAPSTKEMLEITKSLKIANQKILVLTGAKEELVIKSANNLQNVKTLNAKQINVFDLLNANQLLITEAAVAVLEEVYA